MFQILTEDFPLEIPAVPATSNISVSAVANIDLMYPEAVKLKLLFKKWLGKHTVYAKTLTNIIILLKTSQDLESCGVSDDCRPCTRSDSRCC